MNTRYRISPQGRGVLNERQIDAHRDPKRLLFNYHRAVARPKRPLYKDPRSFIALLIIVLLAILITEVVEKEREPGPQALPQQNGRE